MDAGCVRCAKACSTTAQLADGKAVWSWHPDAGVKFAKQFTDDGG
jgi:hypothetical protein